MEQSRSSNSSLTSSNPGKDTILLSTLDHISRGGCPFIFLSFLSLLFSIVVRHRRDTVNRTQSSFSSRPQPSLVISDHTLTTDSNAVATRSTYRRSTILTLTIFISIYPERERRRNIIEPVVFPAAHDSRYTTGTTQPHYPKHLRIRSITLRPVALYI